MQRCSSLELKLLHPLSCVLYCIISIASGIFASSHSEEGEMCQILNLSTERRICRPSKLRSLQSTSQEVENDTHTLFQLFNRFSPVQLSPHSTRCREPCPCCWGHLLLEGEFWNKENYSWNSRLTFYNQSKFHRVLQFWHQNSDEYTILEDKHPNWRHIVWM